MTEGFDFYVGVDWGSEQHHVCIVDRADEIIAEFQVAHSGRGLGAFTDRLARLGAAAPDRIAIAIEVPSGAVVETLLERGHAVYAINPKQLDRFRDRYSPAGAKDDRRDAMVAARALRTDRQCFRQVTLTDPDFVELRELARMDDELVEDRTRLGNRLYAQLNRYYPQILELANSMHEPWIWDLVEAAPTPERARWLKRKTVARILRRNRIHRIGVDEVWSVIKAPPLQVAPGTSEAAALHATSLIPRLRVAHEQLLALRKRTAKKLDALSKRRVNKGEHRDVEIVLSMPGIGTKVGAAMLGEAWQAITDRDYHTLRVLAGTAPVTRASGKSRRVTMRYARNRRFANAVYHWARVASQHDPTSTAYYRRLRERGHTHPRATRQLADRLLRILVAMLRDGSLYDAERPKSVATDLRSAA